jgi:uncharacterized protein involved in type VI secretion and phage assembly
MSDKPTKPGSKKRAGPKAAPSPRRRSKEVATSPSDTTGRVYPALVTSVEDREGHARVKVKLSPLSPDGGGDSFEVWAPVAVPTAERNRGIYFMPRPNDKVLVAFQEGDPRSPVVLGALYVPLRTDVEITLHDSGGRATFTTSGVSMMAAATAYPRQSSSVVSKRETVLLGRINAGLSEHQARRLKSLDAQREEETLTPEEHAELLSLVDKSERLAVDRAEALVELARLRGVTVRSLMNDLGLGVAGCG